MTRAILQNKLRNLAVLAASAFALAACGGGGGGGDHGGGGGLATGTFTRSYNPTDDAIFSSSYFSGTTYHTQSLYLASQINGSGRITKIRVQYAAAEPTAITCPDVTIKMGPTSVTSPTGLSTTYANNVQQGQGTHRTVLANGSIVFPAGVATNWHEIVLGTPFDYNGVDNLVVEITVNTPCDGTFNTDVETTVGYISHIWDANPANPVATSSGDFLADMQFVFAGGDNRQTYGGVNTNTWPFTTGANLRTQTLHLASEINGSGPITGIAFQTNATTVAGTYTYTLRLGHSTLGTLGTTFADNYSGSPTVVGNAVTNFTIPAGVPAGEWIWVPIPDGVFTYNGTDNLLVDVVATAGTATNSLRVTNFGTVRRIYGNAATDTVGVPDTLAVYHIALRFHGGHMTKLTPSATAWNNNTIFNDLWSSATFYSATDLGTAGSITSVSCRLLTASTAASYANFRVVMGHATGSTLSGTAATDFVSQNAVFNGTFPVPGGLLAGDWIDIPLSTPFAYDGKSNLIVWMGNAGPGPGTATVTNCQGESDGARYPGGMGVTQAGAGSASYSPIDWTTDIRMMVVK